MPSLNLAAVCYARKRMVADQMSYSVELSGEPPPHELPAAAKQCLQEFRCRRGEAVFDLKGVLRA